MNSDGFCKTVAVGGARLPLCKNASRSCFLVWFFVEVKDVAALMLGNKIPLLHKHFELIPASGFRHSHFRMDCFWRILQVVPILVSHKKQIEAQSSCVERSVRFIQVALFDLEEVTFLSRHFPMHLHDALIGY